ncbi:MAG TPA: TetR/AcrR family transcriptional regulator [Propionibacteriaceae bacterium]|nr:TetR/AcrR family transcriptional regulator [Propionibacteriaceae bacterium]
MSTPSRPPARRAGQRAGLSSDQILVAARHIADREGVDHLSMRRLSAELGVMPNALYSYFPDKEALLDALLDSLLGEIEMPDPTSVEWRDGLTALMDSSRRLLLAHPQLVTTFISRAAVGPNATRLGETTFQLLRQGGLDGERAVDAFRILLIFTLGFAAFQTPRMEGDASRTRRVRSVFGTLPDDGFPEMRRAAQHLAKRPTDRSFHTGLGWLLQGVNTSNEKAT